MGVQGSIAAVAMCFPVGAIGHPGHSSIMSHIDEPSISAPFAEKPTFSISAGEVVQLFKRQEILSGSSSDGSRLVFAEEISNESATAEHTPSELIVELKRLSGLTWAQISEVFDVKTRALHYWKVGKTVSAENHQKLGGAVAMLRFIDRGTGEENKLLLLSEARDGKTFLELMKGGEFQSIMDLASEGAGRISFGTSLTEEARARNAFPEFSPSQELTDEAEVALLERPQTRRKKIRRAKV